MKKEYLKFDTVKFVTNSQYLQTINQDYFKHEIDMATGEIKSVEFNSRRHQDIIPFELYISVNYQSQKMTIEFSSKILLQNYPQLISNENFEQCLLNIENLGICTLDIDGIIKDSYFNKLHITKDVDLELNSEILDQLNLYTGDYRRYKWDRYSNNAIQFTKNVTAKDCKDSIIVYNKETEISLPKNKAFLNLTNNADAIKEYFKGKTRFEVKMETQRKIRKDLEIEDTAVNRVLHTEKNVVLSQFNKVFIKGKEDEPISHKIKPNNILDYGLLNTIRFYNGDMQKIEQEIKDFGLYGANSRGAMNRQIRRIKEMVRAWSNQEHDTDNEIDQIRALLE